MLLEVHAPPTNTHLFISSHVCLPQNNCELLEDRFLHPHHQYSSNNTY